MKEKKMDIWDEIKKLTGYQSGNGGVDSYGVDHSGFSLHDEIAYQDARLTRENQLAEGFAKQGIAEENYPQFGTNFWGGSPENNYGFGTSNISQNIQNVTNQLNNSANNGQVFANSDYTVNTESLVGKPSSYFQNNNTSGLSNQNVDTLQTTNQSPIHQIVGGTMDMASEYFKMKNHGYKNLDDYHHCKANFNAAARGPYGYNTAKALGDAKEKFDFYWNQYYKGLDEDEAQKDRFHDLRVNATGRLRGNSGVYRNAQDACADYRNKNPAFPKKYW